MLNDMIVSTQDTETDGKLHRLYEDKKILLDSFIDDKVSSFLESDDKVSIKLIEKLMSSGKSDEDIRLINLKLKYYIVSIIQKEIYEHTSSLLSNIQISDYSSHFTCNSKFNQYLKETNISPIGTNTNTLIKLCISDETTSKKTTPKKATSKKATPKKATPKKATPKKTTTKKATPKKTTTKKVTSKKTTPKKTTSKNKTQKVTDEGIPPEVRKHEGIYQSGKKMGQLRPGYIECEQTTKDGLQVIKKLPTKKS